VSAVPRYLQRASKHFHTTSISSLKSLAGLLADDIVLLGNDIVAVVGVWLLLDKNDVAAVGVVALVGVAVGGVVVVAETAVVAGSSLGSIAVIILGEVS